MSPVLPQELDELILEFVIDDSIDLIIYETLTQCALVCRAWRPKSQAILFRKALFVEWESDVSTLYNYRRFLVEHPRFLPLIRRVEFAMPYCNLSLLYDILAIRLPALQTIVINGRSASFKLHRFYTAPHVQMVNIANLELTYVDIVDMAEFYHFILRFPNLSSLLIVDCYWINPDRHTTPRLRKDWKVPVITHLSLAWASATEDELPKREDIHVPMPSAIRLLLQALGANLVYLQINLRTFEYLTSPRFGSDTHELLQACPMPKLERLEIHLRGRVTDLDHLTERPYSAHIGRIPALLKALVAVELRVLGIYLSRIEVRKSEELILDALEQIHGELATLIEGEHFPKLEKIRLDVGARPHTHNWWNPHLAERLPVLAGRGLLETVQFILRLHSRSGPFTDPPGHGPTD
ncbi:hypothetical protein VTO73DRAFT_11011 [Trametes versicolor]